MSTSPVILATGIGRKYGERTVVNNVSLALYPGESVSLMGTSGCGKTTLLHVLSTLDTADSGQLTINGKDPRSIGPKACARLRLATLGFVFQQSNLLPGLTARENVALPAWRLTGRRRDSLDLASRLLSRFGLSGQADLPGHLLSLGEAQRVAVARALINNPRVVFADEPTGSLDSSSTSTVLAALTEVCSLGAALLMVTHDPDVATSCVRRLVMRDGSLIETP